VGREEQLRWERDNARWAAITSGLAALLLTAGGLYAASKISAGADDDAIDQVKLIHAHKGVLISSAVVTALGTVLATGPLYYLFRATRFRRAQLPSGIRYLILIAPVVAAITSVIHQVQTAQLTNKIIAQLPLDVKIAEDRIKDEAGHGAVVAVGGLGTAAGLGIAFAFVLISLNAMRAGLLSRFMGIFGVIVGVTLVIPIQAILQLPFPIVEVWWLGALVALFLNRWPQGRGPAWASGTETLWPGAAEKRAAALGQEPPSRGRGRAQPEPDLELGDEPDEAVEEGPHTGEAVRPRASATHPRSKKRKRKRRG
jgi:hypothetical protein